MSNTILAGMPIVGCASAILSANVVLPYLGRTFMQITPHSMLLVGIIGAVHHFASAFLSDILFAENSSKAFNLSPLFLGSVVSAGVLLALTTVVAKFNLMSGGLSLAGAGALVVTGVVGNILLFNAVNCDCLPKKRKDSF